MKDIFKIVLIALLGVMTQSIYMRMNDGYNKLVMNSSFSTNTFTVSLTTYGSHNTSFFIRSEVFSPGSGRHKVTHSLDEQKLIFDPPLKEQMILFNQYDKNEKNPDSGNGQFWFTLKHNVHKEDENFNFVTLTVSEERRTHSFLLPAFPQPFTFLPSKSFYRCDNVLLSITEIDHYLDFSVFAAEFRSKSWQVEGQWDWKMRSVQRDVTIGRFIRFDKEEQIKINVTDNNFCKFTFRQLPNVQQSAQIWRKTFYKIQQILREAIPLEVSQEKRPQDL